MEGLINDDKAYQDMLLRYSDKPFFTITMPCKKSDFRDKVKDVFILMNRYFESFTLNNEMSQEEKWEEVILNSVIHKKSISIGEKLEFNIPVFYIDDNGIKRSYIKENGITFYFDIDHYRSEILILFVRPNAYTDKNFIEYYDDTKGWGKKVVDQSKAAKINRDNLSNFLSRLEALFDQQISEFGSSYIHYNHIYKYGIRSDAVLDNLPS